MSTEYRTIRVKPETYDRLVDVQKRISGRASISLPAAARGVVTTGWKDGVMPLGMVVAVALEALDDEIRVAPPGSITAEGLGLPQEFLDRFLAAAKRYGLFAVPVEGGAPLSEMEAKDCATPDKEPRAPRGKK